MKKIAPILLLSFCALSMAENAPERPVLAGKDREEVALTIYATGSGLVREVRGTQLPKGEIVVEFQDIPRKIDPTSVTIKSLNAPDALALLDLNAVNSPGQPENAPPRYSMLLSRLRNDLEGPQKIEASYLTDGLSWKADYVATLNADATKLDFRGWASLENKSGAAYPNARIKLTTGGIKNLVRMDAKQMAERARAFAAAGGGEAYAEQAYLNQQSYILDHPVTLGDGEAKQVSLAQKSGLTVKKVYLLDSTAWARGAGAKWSEKGIISAVIETDNSPENGLGVALPQGRARIYTTGADGTLDFAGEDRVDHTAPGGKLRLTIGKAYDITADRAQSDYKKISDREVELTYTVTIHNGKVEEIEAVVTEHAHGVWEITKESHPHRMADERTIEYRFPVSGKSDAVLSYTVRVRT